MTGKVVPAYSPSVFSRMTTQSIRPGPGQVLIEVAACGVCRTDLAHRRQRKAHLASPEAVF
jgi:D-arabinose 1-dehydrogenase-like Zn-dependent alcohol dehydrogenase